MVDKALLSAGIKIEKDITFFELGCFLLESGQEEASDECFAIDMPADKKFFKIDDSDADVYALKDDCWDDQEQEWSLLGTGFEGAPVVDISTPWSGTHCDISIVDSEKGFYAKSNFGSKHKFKLCIFDPKDKDLEFIRCFTDARSCEEFIIGQLCIDSQLSEKDISIKRLH